MERKVSVSTAISRQVTPANRQHTMPQSSKASIRMMPSFGSVKTTPGRGTRGCMCSIFRGNNRLLILAGLLLLTCYLVSELVLRSWSLEESEAQWTRDCTGTRSINPNIPSVICDQKQSRGTQRPTENHSSEFAANGAPGNDPQEVDSIEKPMIGNSYEIVVDRADLQPINQLRNPGAELQRDRRRKMRRNYHFSPTQPLVNEQRRALAGPLVMSQGSKSHRPGNLSPKQSTWTLWEGSKNGSHLQFISADVLHYRNALEEQIRLSTPSPEMIALEKKFYTRHPERVNPHEFNLLNNASGVCAESPFLIVIIPSLPSSRDRRNAIRETWGSVARSGSWPNEDLKEKVNIAFLLGRTESFQIRMGIKQEYEQYGDIVQEDFLESYRNLSLKTVMGIKWVVNFCSGARYIMKCDDDMIAHIPMILKMLKRHRYQNAIVGHVNKGAVVQRQGLWALSPEEFPFDHFPPYASGTAYIISGDIVLPLFQMSEHVPLVPIEDVYVTGVLAKMVGSLLVHQNGFTSWNAFSPRTCDVILGRILTGTKMTSNSLRRMWQRIKGGGPNCNRDAPNIVMARMNRNER